MSFSRLSCNKGISLLEVMVSMLVLAFGVLGLAPMLVLSIEGNVISRDNSIVSLFLKDKVESFENSGSLPPLPYEEVEESLEDRFTRITSIRDSVTDASIPFGVCQCDVRVIWTDHQEIKREATYSTFILVN